MKGDFSRSTFRPEKHYSSVRMQQGRIQLDADWNEQMDILRHLLTSQVKDIVGHAGGKAAAFKIDIKTTGSEASPGATETPATIEEPGVDTDDVERPDMAENISSLPALTINSGRYYVDGILCENHCPPDSPVEFSVQPDLPEAVAAKDLEILISGQTVLAYLDVWQRHITRHEDPEIQEVALGGIDTTTRTKTVWQVRLLPVDPEQDVEGQWQAFVAGRRQHGYLRVKRAANVLDNQLYRIEVHEVLEDGSVVFKWAADNASTLFQVVAIEGTGDDLATTLTFTVDGLTSSIAEGDLVELEDDTFNLAGRARPLATVEEISRQHSKLTIRFEAGSDLTWADLELLPSSAPTPHDQDAFQEALNNVVRDQHVVLRRWENRSMFKPGVDWQDLNGFLKLQLVAPSNNADSFRQGDYWWIPARTALGLHGDIEWPDGQALPPHGIEHYYALLAMVDRDGDGGWQVTDMRPRFYPLTRIANELDNYQEETRTTLQELTKILDQLQSVLAHGIDAALAREVNRTGLLQNYPATEPLEVGHVVSIAVDEKAPVEEDEPLRIAHADAEDAQLTIGVVVNAPALHTEDAEYTVALYGLAQCQVIGKVAAGDILVPSDRAGYARRGGFYIKPGSVIGKALSSNEPNPEFPDLAGIVNILVTLG